MNNNSNFFQNKNCPYFPCHKTENLQEFNCMFCYCPLYTLADKCGGNYKILSNGIKDCSNCIISHSPNFAKVIESKFNLIKNVENFQRNIF